MARGEGSMARDEVKRPSEGCWEKGLKKKMVEQRGERELL